MGRPIKKKFFANTNVAVTGEGVGGEQVAAITVSNSGTLYSQGTTLSISAPQIPGGQTATFDYSINSNGNIAVTLLDGGSGYTSAPTLTVTTASVVTQYVTNSGVTATNTLSVASVVGIQVGMRIYGGANGGRVTAVDPVLNRVTSSQNNDNTWTNANNLKFYDQGSGFAKSITLTSNLQNGLSVVAYIPTGASAKTADIIKQEAAHRYLVRTADGVGQCRLVASDSPAAGEMNITATDNLGSTYWVTKLTARRCVLTQRSNGGSGYAFATGNSAGWNITSPATGVVSIASV